MIEIPDGEAVLWRPVARGWCKAESIYDGSLDLEAFARMNNAIDVFDHNRGVGQPGA